MPFGKLVVRKNQIEREVVMFNQSPLETLASFAIVFAAGAASVYLISAYGQWMKRKGEECCLS